MPNATRLDALTGTRFVAAAWVALFHFTHLIDYPKPLKMALTSGASAVSFFFVLSGFVLMHTYAGRLGTSFSRSTYAAFAWARVARLYPMYLFSFALLTANILICLAVRRQAIEQHFGVLPSDGYLFATWIANLLLAQVYFPTLYFEQFWNSAAWSVSCECAFYVAFPFLAIGITRAIQKGRGILKIAGVVLVVQAAVFLLGMFLVRDYAMYLPTPQPGPNYTYIVTRLPFFRIFEFIIGMLTAAAVSPAARANRLSVWMSDCKTRNRVLAAALATCVAIAACHAFLLDSPVRGILSKILAGDLALLIVWSGFDIIFYTVPFALIIGALATGRTFLSSVLENRTVVLLGEASYALYILHIGTWHFIAYRQVAGILPGGMFPSIALLGTVGLSVICYLLIENPARRRLRTWFEGKRSESAEAASVNVEQPIVASNAA